jgi:hypothetical protein
MMLAAAAAGFAGGAVSASVPWVVRAQESVWPREVRSQRFLVVEPNGKKRAEFGLAGGGKVTLRIYDERGQVVWSAPDDLRIYPAKTP